MSEQRLGLHQWVWHPALEVHGDRLVNPYEGTTLGLSTAVQKLRREKFVPLARLDAEVARMLTRHRFVIPERSADAGLQGLLRRSENPVAIDATGSEKQRHWGLIGANIWQAPEPDIGVHDVTSGLRRGIRRSLDAATNPAAWDWARNRPVNESTLSLTDHGDLIVDPRNDTAKSTVNRLRAATRTVIAQEQSPLVIGGDHSIGYPVIMAQRERWDDLAVVHFDAHADARAIPEGQQTADCGNFATWCRAEYPDLPWLTLGVRGFDAGLSSAAAGLTTYIRSEDAGEIHKVAQLDRHCEKRPVHITVDIDVLDPSYAPEVAYPSPGGLTPALLAHLIDRIVQRHNVVGLDISEVCGPMTRRNQAALLAVDTMTRVLAPREISQ